MLEVAALSGTIKYIPTITGRVDTAHTVALCSPSVKKGLRRGSKLTIVDCYTYYLRKFASQLGMSHYRWLADFAKDNLSDPSLVFVAPDCDWLGETFTQEYLELWPRHGKQLVVYGSALFAEIHNPVGWAITTRCRPEVIPYHISWVHHFSQNFVPYTDARLIQSYDSIYPCHD